VFAINFCSQIAARGNAGQAGALILIWAIVFVLTIICIKKRCDDAGYVSPWAVAAYALIPFAAVWLMFEPTGAATLRRMRKQAQTTLTNEQFDLTAAYRG
jgi:hypothetical protein